jgi:hypothetical protein
MTDHTTIGPPLPQPDIRGWLVFEWLPDDLQNAEDTRQVADHAQFKGVEGFPAWVRKATAAEIALLRHLHLDLDHLDGDLMTVVSYPAPGIRRRRWPQLETQDATPGAIGLGHNPYQRPRSINVREIQP